MATDDSEEGQGKMVGISINSVRLKGQPRGPDDFLTWVDPQKEPKIHKILKFVNQVSSDIDYYNNYGVEKVREIILIKKRRISDQFLSQLFRFEMLNVSKSYGGKGIAAMLVEQSINVARERGFKCLISETTGKST